MGEVFAVFCLGLLPYTVFQMQLRVFYAVHDSRTPAFIGTACMILNIAVNYAALALLPPGPVVAGLGAGFGAANTLGACIAWRILSRRLGGLGGHEILGSLLRMHAAALPAAGLAIALSLATRATLPAGVVGALATVVLAGGGAVALYLLLARLFEVRELTALTAAIASRIRRRAAPR
jgi:putative peptidoglycan lipid II flippase